MDSRRRGSSWDYPEADGYGEIAETHVVPGGETGNSALVLSRWGHNVKVAGPFLGLQTREGVLGFLETRGIDCSALHFDASFDGVRDLVLVGGKTRTVLGTFGGYFRGPRRWQEPERTDIEAADVVGLDPFFGAESLEVARLSREAGRPYVTIDCGPDSALHAGASATIVSSEYIRSRHPEAAPEELLRSYTGKGPGLVIFTFGSEDILYCRGRGTIRHLKPFKVAPKSTLGAGDGFRGGVVHGVVRGMEDEAIVRFAAATAACACLRFPMAYDPPSLEEITSLAATAAG